MNGRQKKNGLGEKTLRFAFGALLIAAAVGLFLLSDAGRHLLAGDSAAEGTAAGAPGGTAAVRATDAPTEPPGPLPEEVIDAAKQKGAKGNYALASDDGDALGYAVLREGQSDVSLTLLLESGRVSGFTLAWTIAPAPTPPPESPTPVEGDLYRRDQESHRADLAWFENAFFAITRALDAGGSLSAAKLELLYGMACDTRGDGKRRDASEGDFDFVVSREEGDEGSSLRVVFCRKR